MLATNARLCDCIYVKSVYDTDGAYDGTAQTMHDMRDWDGCLVLLLPAATTASATHHITGFKIVSNTSSTGGGTDHDIAEAVTTDGGTTKTLAAADVGTSAPTTVHNQLLALDIRADQMYAGDRYIAAVTTKTGTYTCVICYIFYRGNYTYKDLIQAGTRTAFQYDGNL